MFNGLIKAPILTCCSDLALQVRKAAADCEDQFQGAGQSEGIEIWRIENFGVRRWPKEQYGRFYTGDSYIILHSFKKADSDMMMYNVHFWLGAETSQDEAGTAAWKTVELDDILGQLPIQYREVQDHESDEFMSLFSNPGMMVMDGGIDSAFNVVEPTVYKPRLLHVKGVRNNVRVRQVPMALESLTQGDVFVLDNGLQLFQWNGTESGVFEKRKGNQVCQVIRDDRQSRPEFQVLDGEEECDAFWSLLGGMGPIRSAAEGGDDRDAVEATKRMMRLSDASGSLTMTEVASGKVMKSDLTSDDVFLVDDSGMCLYVWVGNGASREEKAKAFQYANKYIVEMDMPLTIPVSRMMEDNTSAAFDNVFA